VSTISAVPRTYEAYYRPENYRWADVRTSLHVAAERGITLNINLLVLPGLTDRPEEIDALIALLQELPAGVLQLRNLNADPKRALAAFEAPRTLLGIAAAIERYRDSAPHFSFASFTRPAAAAAAS
jgi:pyruvate-formate lyase-activating enzyme